MKLLLAAFAFCLCWTNGWTRPRGYNAFEYNPAAVYGAGYYGSPYAAAGAAGVYPSFRSASSPLYTMSAGPISSGYVTTMANNAAHASAAAITRKGNAESKVNANALKGAQGGAKTDATAITGQGNSVSVGLANGVQNDAAANVNAESGKGSSVAIGDSQATGGHSTTNVNAKATKGSAGGTGKALVKGDGNAKSDVRAESHGGSATSTSTAITQSGDAVASANSVSTG